MAGKGTPPIPGYKRLPGSARQYVNISTGEVFSRRQYDKIAASVKAAPVRKGSMVRYNRMVSDFQAYMKREHGIEMTRREVRQSADMKSIVKDLRSKDTSPDGKKAKALVRLGRRRPEADYPVGDTPKE